MPSVVCPRILDTGFAVESYEEEIAKDSTYLEQEYKDEAVEFQVERNFTGTEVSRKFVVAVKKNGEYVAVSRPHYITNPEAAAKRRSDGRKPSTKKGLLVDPNKLRCKKSPDRRQAFRPRLVTGVKGIIRSGSDSLSRQRMYGLWIRSRYII